ncbi:ABC transporter ATP-binding protein [Nocardiopsis nanhaiensis]
MPTIEMHDVRKTFPAKGSDVEVLKGIDVGVESGEFLAILGASGCGKSTLLRLVSGLEPVSSGTVRIAGRDVTDLPPEKRELAMVFQNYALFPHLTAKENILFGLKSRRESKQVQNDRLAETAQLLGLEELLSRRPAELSGGQRQRVALGRALVSGQRLILMDEPLSNLDAKLRAEMRTEIKRIQRQLDLTIIYVTHDQVEAMTMADRVMMLSDGSIEQLASPGELYRAPATTVVGQFIGSPPMNILDVPAHSELAALGPARLQDEGGSLGVRPERLKLHHEAEPLSPGHGAATVSPDSVRLGKATVLVNELLGADRLITATLHSAADQRIVARIEPDQQVAADDTVVVTTTAPAIHWYAADTGRRLDGTPRAGALRSA